MKSDIHLKEGSLYCGYFLPDRIAWMNSVCPSIFLSTILLCVLSSVHPSFYQSMNNFVVGFVLKSFLIYHAIICSVISGAFCLTSMFCSAVREYVVSTLTGDGFGSGTDALVYINLIGTIGDSGKRFLVHNLEGTDKFESGQVLVV